MSGTPHICVCKICSQTFIPKVQFGHRCPECIRMRRIALPKWAAPKLLRIVALLAVTFAVFSMVIGVAQPGGWYSPSILHLGKHGWLGVGSGALGWGTAYAFDGDQTTRCLSGIGTGFVVGFGYEILRAKGSTLLDPVDALWVVTGSALTVGLAELGLDMVTIEPRADGVVVGKVWRF